MDLIASIIASALTFIVSILGNLLAHDICVSADRTCAKIIRKAAARLAPFDREPRESEWLADLCERETIREKYQHAIGCFLIAGKMRRQASALILAMNLQIDGVGNIPLTLKLNSRVLKPLFLKAATAKSKKINNIAIVLGILYLRLKLIRSAKASLGPSLKKITTERLTQCKISEVHLKWGRMDVDIDKIFRLFRLFIEELGTKFAEYIQSLTKPQSAPSETLGGDCTIAPK
jgi:hypothetical protein